MEPKILPNQKVAEVELRYRTNINPKDRAQVKSSKDAYEIFLQSWNRNTIEYFEEFKVLLLNRNHRVLGMTTLTKGSTSGTIVDVKQLLQYVLKTNAPSVDTKWKIIHTRPSEDDLRQMFTYNQLFNSTRSFLAYPGDWKIISGEYFNDNQNGTCGLAFVPFIREGRLSDEGVNTFMQNCIIEKKII